MNEQAMAIIESRNENMKNNKERKAPIIYPIVLSTSRRIWDAPLTIIQDEKK